MNVVDLFAGTTGMLSGQWLKGWKTVCYVERAKYAVEVIRARIRDGYLDDAPIWDDVGTFDGRPWRGFVDVVKAGFPCQPFSVAGKGLAGNDPRDGWPDTIRIIREIRPPFVYLENVPGLLAGSHGYFGRILRELAKSGYHAKWRVLSAAELGAPHKRDRLWIVGYSKQVGQHGQPRRRAEQKSKNGHLEMETGHVAHPTRQYAHRSGERSEQARRGESANGCEIGWWAVEPRLDRVAHGVAHRVDRLKAIGNGEVPIVAQAAWNLLTEEL